MNPSPNSSAEQPEDINALKTELAAEKARKEFWIANCEALANERTALRKLGSGLAEFIARKDGPRYVNEAEYLLSFWDQIMRDTDIVSVIETKLNSLPGRQPPAKISPKKALIKEVEFLTKELERAHHNRRMEALEHGKTINEYKELKSQCNALTAALKAVADEAKVFDDGPASYSGDSYLPEHLHEMIRAALAKAKGQTP